MREMLAAWCHEQWSGWMRHVFSNGTFGSDGVWTMSAREVERRQYLMNTPYSGLSERAKDKDREQADKLLAAFNWWDPTVLGPDTEIYVAKPSE